MILRHRAHSLLSFPRGENVQLRAQLAQMTKDPVLVLPASYCVLCSKPFTKGGIARLMIRIIFTPITPSHLSLQTYNYENRYPNGVTLHADCVKDERVCPLTGQVSLCKRIRK